ncbi:hypothetical protein C3L33_05801, partial [Rhododendron williamsianum]
MDSLNDSKKIAPKTGADNDNPINYGDNRQMTIRSLSIGDCIKRKSTGGWNSAMGLALLSLASWLFLIKPEGCGDGEQVCMPVSSIGTALFYLATYLVAFGYGGHQPTIATFGSDQFDEANPKEKSSKAAFFCYFYFALNVGSLFSNTFLVYYEDNGKWTMGFWLSTGSAVIALVSFLLGSPGYRYIKPCGNPLPRVAQVFVAAARKWYVVPADECELYEVEGSESAIKGSRKIHHSSEFE